MDAIKRNALLKELSCKLEDQGVYQSAGVFSTLPDNSGVARNDARRKNHILYERSRNLTETLISNPEK